MFDEKKLDPHGVGNLPHILTVTNKSSTFGVREVPIYFWLNFKLKREYETAAEGMFKMNQAVLVIVLIAYGKG